MLEKSSQFLSLEQPCEPKSLDVALKIAGVEKLPSKKFVVAVNLEAIWPFVVSDSQISLI